MRPILALHFACNLIIVLFSAQLSAQQEKIDSLIKVRNGMSGIDQAIVTQYIAQEYISVNEDSALAYIRILDEYLEEDYDKEIDAFTLKLRGLIAEYNFDYKASMEYRKKSFELFKEVGNYGEMGWTARGIGVMFYELGSYANATEYFILSLSAFETDNNKRGIADIYNLLGAVNYVTGHSEKALDYYNSSIELFQEIGENFIQSKVYNNIGIILFEEKAYEEALGYYEKAMTGFQVTGYEEGICGAYGNMSLCYFELGQIDKALEYIHKSRRLAIKNKKVIDEISSYVNIGSFYREIMQLDSAQYYLDKALLMSEQNELKPLLEEAYNEMSKLYEVRQDYKAAFNYHVKYFEIREEIHQEDSEVRIENLMTSYEQRIRQQEIDMLTSDQKSKTLLNKVFGALIVLTGMSLFIMVYAYTNNRKKNRQLEDKNIELIESNAKLVESEAALRKVIDDKNRLFTIIAHDLRNPVAAVSGFSELLYDNFDQLDSTTQKDYVSQVIQGSTRTYELLENLLLWARSQMDSIVVKKTDTSIDKLISDSLASLHAHIQRKDIDVSVSKTCTEMVYADYEMIQAVLRNLLTNAVKFSFPGGKIEIKCLVEEDFLLLSVIDQGIGIEPEVIKGLFSQKGGTTTPGTSGESGSGLGLMICKDYTERNGGQISVESKPGLGSTFTISLPLNKDLT